MSEIYPILLGKNCIGQASVSRQGLYYQIACACRLSGEVVYRVRASCADKAVNLGILVPENGLFAVRSRVAISKLGVGALSFCAIPQHVKTDDNFIPLKPDEPFAYLHRMDGMYLSKRGSQIGLCIKESEDQSSGME